MGVVVKVDPAVQVVIGAHENYSWLSEVDSAEVASLIEDVAYLIVSKSDILEFPEEYTVNVSKFLTALDSDQTKSFFSAFKDGLAKRTEAFENAIVRLHTHSVEWKKTLVKSNKEKVLSSLSRFKKKESCGSCGDKDGSCSVDSPSEDSGEDTSDRPDADIESSNGPGVVEPLSE